MTKETDAAPPALPVEVVAVLRAAEAWMNAERADGEEADHLDICVQAFVCAGRPGLPPDAPEGKP